MARKRPIHTTLSVESYRIIERFEHELGGKNEVLEKALLNLGEKYHKGKMDSSLVKRKFKRISTGVIGFDNLVEGGIPEGFIVAITGPPGTGKTTFSIQFLLNGVEQHERCILFSFEESVSHIVNQFRQFDKDLLKYIDEGYLELYGQSMISIEELVEIIELYSPTRVVFDSMNAYLGMEDVRNSTAWRNVTKLLKKMNITCILITEKKYGLHKKEFDDYDFMSDGIIFMDKIIGDSIDRFQVTVLKMRSTNIQSVPKDFTFKKDGINVYSI